MLRMHVPDAPDGAGGRALLAAAARPLNLAVLAGLLAAAIFVAPWLVAAALPIYALMVAASMQEGMGRAQLRRAATVELPPPDPLAGLEGELRERISAAMREQEATLHEFERLPVVPDGVSDAVRALGADLITTAGRAADVDRYLAGVDVERLRVRLGTYRADPSEGAADAADALAEQLEVVEHLVSGRRQLDSELARVEAALGAIRARAVQARAAAATPPGLSADVQALRDRVRILASSLGEAYAPAQIEPPRRGA
jgi:hypothetical protein